MTVREFVASARAAYPTKAYRSYTNTLVRSSSLQVKEWRYDKFRDVPKDGRVSKCETTNDVRWVDGRGYRNHPQDAEGQSDSKPMTDGVVGCQVGSLKPYGRRGCLGQFHASLTIFTPETVRCFVENAMPIRVMGLPEARKRSV